MTIRRGLAFYKRSGKPWTLQEYKKVILYTEGIESNATYIRLERLSKKYLYDEGTSVSFMYFWEGQDVRGCTKVAYEDIFHTKLLKPRKQEWKQSHHNNGQL